MTNRLSSRVYRFQTLRDPMVGILADWFGLKHRPAQLLLALYRAREPITSDEIAAAIDSKRAHIGQHLSDVRRAMEKAGEGHRSVPLAYGGKGFQLTERGRKKVREAFDWVAEQMGLEPHRVQILEAALALPSRDDCPPGLTPKEADVYRLLKSGRMLSRDGIHTVLYGHMPECDQPNMKIIDVFLVKLRKKLPPSERIKGIWGQGWRLVRDEKIAA